MVLLPKLRESNGRRIALQRRIYMNTIKIEPKNDMNFAIKIEANVKRQVFFFYICDKFLTCLSVACVWRLGVGRHHATTVGLWCEIVWSCEETEFWACVYMSHGIIFEIIQFSHDMTFRIIQNYATATPWTHSRHRIWLMHWVNMWILLSHNDSNSNIKSTIQFRGVCRPFASTYIVCTWIDHIDRFTLS